MIDNNNFDEFIDTYSTLNYRYEQRKHDKTTLIDINNNKLTTEYY